MVTVISITTISGNYTLGHVAFTYQIGGAMS